jgi:hypothetical protein
MAKFYTFLLFAIFLSSCEKTPDDGNNVMKFYGDALEDIGYGVATYENGYVIVGQLTDVSRDVVNYIDEKLSVKKFGVIKTDINGNIIWKKSFGNSVSACGSKVLITSDGNIVCTGYITTDPVSLSKDVLAIKLNSEGTVSIEKTYKTEGNQYGTDIVETQDGFIILATTDAASGGNVAGKKDIFLIKTDNNLDSLSSAVFGFPGNDEGVALKKDVNGSYIIAGTTETSFKPAAEQSLNNIILIRVDDALKILEFRILGGVEDEYMADFEVLNDGYFLAGNIGIEGPDQRGYVWKLPEDIFSDPIIEHKIEIVSGGTTENPFSIHAISTYKTNSFVFAGQYGTGTTAKMLLFVTGADGNLVEGKRVIMGGTGLQVFNDVISDENDNIIAVGKNSYEKNSMISLLKIRF